MTVEKTVAALKANPDKALAEVIWSAKDWHGDVVQRYEAQWADPQTSLPSIIHVVRLGGLLIDTIPV